MASDEHRPVDPDVTVNPRPYPHPWALIRSDADLLPAIAVGGALGSLARWGLAQALPHAATAFPWATFLTNLGGSLLLGLLMAFVLGLWSSTRYVRPFLGVGVLGGFTTFSTFMVELHAQLSASAFGLFALYLVGSVVGGLLAVSLGLSLGRGVVGRRATA